MQSKQMEAQIVNSNESSILNLDQNNQLPKQKLNNHPNHSQHAHDELDSNCEGCQAQKKQNQKLVDFYQRLDKISNKVRKIKIGNNSSRLKQNKSSQIQGLNQLNWNSQSIKNQSTSQKLQIKLKELNQKLNISQLPSVGQIKELSSKQIGYELAAALIQRQMKYKNQNKKLQDRINGLLAQRNKRDQNQSQFQSSNLSKLGNSLGVQDSITNQNFYADSNKPRHSRQQVHDSLDDLKNQDRSQNKKYKINKQDSSYWDMDGSSSGYQQTAFFETKKRNSNSLYDRNRLIKPKQSMGPSEQDQSISSKTKKNNPYNTQHGYGLNLWLYQFKTQQLEDKLMNSWISDKNKSQRSQRYRGSKKANNQLDKPSAKINVNRTSIIGKNRTSIIEKNIINDYNNVKRKPY